MLFLFCVFCITSKKLKESSATLTPGWMPLEGCSDLCSLPFPISRFPQAVLAPQSLSLPPGLPLAPLSSLREPVQISSAAETTLGFAEFSCPLKRLTWLKEDATGACTQERDWVGPTTSNGKLIQLILGNLTLAWHLITYSQFSQNRYWCLGTGKKSDAHTQ